MNVDNNSIVIISTLLVTLAMNVINIIMVKQ